MKTEENTKEPAFFLKDELIYFLKKHADIVVTETRHDKDSLEGESLITQFKIDGQLICSSRTSLPARANPERIREIFLEETVSVKQELAEAKNDIRILVHHMLSQQERIDKIETQLAQYITKP